MTVVHPVLGTPVPTGWELVSVDGIKSDEKSSCVAGPFGSDISSRYFVPEGVPVIRGSNLTDDLTTFISDSFVFVSPERALSYPAQHVKAGDLVFTCWGTIGQVGLIPKDGPYPEYVISNKQLKLRPNPSRADSLFLFYYFASPAMVGYIRSRAIGSAVPGINLGILKSLPICLPPLPIQQRIVAVLSAYDEVIENNNHRIKLLEEMAQRIYREWFVEFRYPGQEMVPRVESEMGPIPLGWAVRPLGEVCASVADGDWIETKDQGGDAYRLLQVSNIGLGSFRETGNYRYISEETFTRLRCTEVKLRSILVSRMPDPVGRAWYVDHLDEPAITAVDVAIVTPDEAVIDPRYCAFYLNTPQNLQYAAQRASGTTRLRITRRDLETFRVLLPPSHVRTAFGRVLEEVGRLGLALNLANRNLHATRDLLLPRLISGEIDVTDLDIAVPEAAA